MIIARIAAKGRDVVSTQPHWTLAEVAEVLVAKNIGAVVVADDSDSVIGILSEREIIRAFPSAAPPCSTTLCQCR
ncbi:MAG: CBS domain-containing protein [Methylocella sp.]|nr:MAG: hypothetical protein DLM68_05445 [Hyphomicrobiales bacterium]